ncbi:hypothetical protein LO763_15180 [Glycomyces sp. A-F 0318]|uniref:hypothetical protein n=1 Tax=Glycomyces amatae TaxID=2881355 RepID=UPI001E2D485D|nr:hypothetical protein [Glycomyces amatae]MCD0444960.1 hypothetical protein [Glycomyces amatae]
MALPAPLTASASLVLALLVLSACSDDWICSDTTAERGKAASTVEVESVWGDTGVTAAITEWRLEPHPQTPDEGDQVFFDYRLVSEDRDPWNIELDVCAVDADRVALACTTIDSGMAWGQDDGALTGDGWFAVEHPERVDAVLLVPNDQSEQRHDCDDDLKDGGGPHPPEPVSPGDRL